MNLRLTSVPLLVSWLPAAVPHPPEHGPRERGRQLSAQDGGEYDPREWPGSREGKRMPSAPRLLEDGRRGSEKWKEADGGMVHSSLFLPMWLLEAPGT